MHKRNWKMLFPGVIAKKNMNRNVYQVFWQVKCNFMDSSGRNWKCASFEKWGMRRSHGLCNVCYKTYDQTPLQWHPKKFNFLCNNCTCTNYVWFVAQHFVIKFGSMRHDSKEELCSSTLLPIHPIIYCILSLLQIKYFSDYIDGTIFHLIAVTGGFFLTFNACYNDKKLPILFIVIISFFVGSDVFSFLYKTRKIS